MKKIVQLTEEKLKNLIKEAIVETINESKSLHAQKMELEELYNRYLEDIENKYGKTISELAQTTDLHILSWLEFAKKHGSKELYQYIKF